ncbi:Cut9-interacting protein scn1 [Coemansia biformis]|uniref:Cut9-interacting protein scn1 n=1 Tax=Coemansia biformis TaxID=1286918 RepID=A0A9W7YB75_9FUNG|nr:Cut9-interacting protein scn1 [Coemansia biformis]
MEGAGGQVAVVYDVHCHIHETPEALCVLDTLDTPERRTVFCVQATKYADWDDVIRLGEQHPGKVVPAVGVHPWCVLGECGIDKAARSPETHQVYPLDLQLQVFVTQLAIAHEVGVPVSIHCVRAFGQLADVLRDAERRHALPPRIMLHSYSGSPDMLQQVFFNGELGTRVYVSFSTAVNGRGRAKSMQCIRVAPADRLLVESDLHCAHTALPALDGAVDLVAEARGWLVPEARRVLARNSRAFFGDAAAM